MITSICLYLHLHQPYRFREYSVFDIGKIHDYWDSDFSSKQSNERIFKKVSDKSYRPTLTLLERTLKENPDFAVSFSITGTWLEQAFYFDRGLLDILRRIMATGRAEIVAETYYHSLSFFHDREEFESQVTRHKNIIKKLFDYTPTTFRNTELAYRDDLAIWAEQAGYQGILAEGWDNILEWRSPNYHYSAKDCNNLSLLLKNYRLSDDIAFRFSDQSWPEWPLTAEKYLEKLQNQTGDVINLFMDFETFGEHQWKETGIFDFLTDFIKKWTENGNKFLTLSDSCKKFQKIAELSMPNIVTWADTERDLSAWESNKIQKSASDSLYSLRQKILASKDKKLIRDFRRLTTSDHTYYMSTKYWNDGDVHAYFSAYDSPYDAYLSYSNILRDLEYRLSLAESDRKSPTRRDIDL